MSRLIAIVAVVLVFPNALQDPRLPLLDDRDPWDSTGLGFLPRPFAVRVVVAPSNLVSIQSELVKARVELALRREGITLADVDTRDPRLNVRVWVVDLNNKKAVVFEVTLGLTRTVAYPGPANVRAQAHTWTRNYIGYSRVDGWDDALSGAIDKVLGLFLNDYYKAKPKTKK